MNPTVPRALVLWADEGSTNLGVAVLARGSVDLLRRAFGDLTVEVVAAGVASPHVPWRNRKALIAELVRPRVGMRAYLGSFDVIWDTRSGDSFADIYGLERHVTMGLIHEFAAQSGARIAMAPQTIGPFGGRSARWIARRNLARSHLVFARDPESFAAARALGREPDALSADLVFALESTPPTTARDVLFNVSGLLWQENPHVDAGMYRDAVVDSVRRLEADGRRVSLFAHVLDSPSPDNDVPALREAERRIGHDLELVIPRDLDDARGAIAGAELVVASRMHACLNALSLGVPTLPLAYSRKFAPLLSSVGWDAGCDLRTGDASGIAAHVARTAGTVTAERAAEAARRGRASLRPVEEAVRALATVGG